ncbi:MAG: acylphosphatase [Chloroflexi bacterium]|nr:acylphosphatase [Chloroflexota bacterium]
MKRLKAIVHGRVQGVGFRVFVLRHAQALGLTGTVRNVYSPTRHVEVIAEGPEDKLKQLLAQLKIGPSMSWVERVEVEWSEPTGEFSYFSIV